jgi:hypothetical protein
MDYVFTNAEGQKIRLRVDCVKGGVTHLVEMTDDVVIPAQQVYDDLVAEISMSGSHFGRAHEVITDRYSREHENVTWEGLTAALRVRLVSYLEELRKDARDDEHDTFFNDGLAWTAEDIYI